ncbi:MAG: delta-60 repeat domain-containing protein [Acidimicrobiales bacterium]
MDMFVARITASGEPDVTFGSAGVALVDFSAPEGLRDDMAMAVAVQADSRIVIAGQSQPTSDIVPPVPFALARLSAAGELDPTFGDGGRVLTPLPPSAHPYSYVNALAVQPDGKIVAVGTARETRFSNSRTRSVVARYATTGALDPTFASGGAWVNDGDEGDEGEGMAVAIDAAGRIVVGGARTLPSAGDATSDVEVVRLLPSGTPDPTFGGSGRIVTRLTPGFDSHPGARHPARRPRGGRRVRGQRNHRAAVHAGNGSQRLRLEPGGRAGHRVHGRRSRAGSCTRARGCRVGVRRRSTTAWR